MTVITYVTCCVISMKLCHYANYVNCMNYVNYWIVETSLKKIVFETPKLVDLISLIDFEKHLI